MELIADILPSGVITFVTASVSRRASRLRRTSGSPRFLYRRNDDGRMIMQYGLGHIIPVTLELGGKRRISSLPMS